MNGKRLQIGIFNTQPVIHGGSTLSVTWAESLRQAGEDVEIFTMSRSGKILANWRKDGAFETVLASNDFSRSSEYIRKFDVVIPLGGFFRGEDNLQPAGTYPILEQAKAIFMYHGRGLPDREAGKIETRRYLGWIYALPNMVGLGMGGPAVEASFRGDPVVGDYIRHRGFSFYWMRHPAILPRTGPQISPGQGLLSMARFVPSKKLGKLLKFVRQNEHLFTDDFPFRMYGDAFVSRERYLVSQAEPEMYQKYYHGPYDSTNLTTLLHTGAYTIDLTNYVSGAQCSYFEALAHGVVPIVMKQWSLNDSAITMDSPEEEDILKAIETAIALPWGERLQLIKRGWSYMQEHHDPWKNGRALGSHLRNLLGL